LSIQIEDVSIVTGLSSNWANQIMKNGNKDENELSNSIIYYLILKAVQNKHFRNVFLSAKFSQFPGSSQ
jgi:hypothetical protein